MRIPAGVILVFLSIAVSTVFANPPLKLGHEQLDVVERAFVLGFGDTSASTNEFDLSVNGAAKATSDGFSNFWKTYPRVGINESFLSNLISGNGFSVPTVGDFKLAATSPPTPEELKLPELLDFSLGISSENPYPNGANPQNPNLPIPITLVDYILGVVSTMLLGLIGMILTPVCGLLWCLFRGCLGLCGGRSPKPEGYSRNERMLPLGFVAVICVIMLFGSFTAVVSEDFLFKGVDVTFGAFNSALDRFETFDVDFNATVVDALDVFDDIVEEVLAQLEVSFFVGNATQLVIDDVDAVRDQLVLIDDKFSNLRNTSVLPTVQSTIASTQMLIVDAISQIGLLTNLTDGFLDQVEEQEQLLRDQVNTQVEVGLEQARAAIRNVPTGDVIDPVRAQAAGVNEQIAAYQPLIDLGIKIYLLFPTALTLLAILGGVFRKGCFFTIAHMISWPLLFVGFLVLFIFSPIGIVFNDTCEFIPAAFNSAVPDSIKTVITECRDEDITASELLDLAADVYQELTGDVLPVDGFDISRYIDRDVIDQTFNDLVNGTLNVGEYLSYTDSFAGLGENLTVVDPSDFSVDESALDFSLEVVNNITGPGEAYWYSSLNLTTNLQNDYDTVFSIPTQMALDTVMYTDIIAAHTYYQEVLVVVEELITNLTDISNDFAQVGVLVGDLVNTIGQLEQDIYGLSSRIDVIIDILNGSFDRLFAASSDLLSCFSPISIIDTFASGICDTTAISMASLLFGVILMVLLLPCFLCCSCVAGKRVGHPEKSIDELGAMDFGAFEEETTDIPK